ncbi:DNA topoisomerase III [Reticulomyxa filosa]|uniref:DNA topoisomerase n=1 Tax=Reticulomyxa filosa TaxID=46433 RepID=X6P674_RETFI|nr:DNA topoisomerase III [Reticulomyxa filosa]|eukprot:ETO34020.1 DNA topoisomerase III [Reticulomyxa filosa]
MLFTSVAGHLMELDFVEPYNKWGICPDIELFEKETVKTVPEVVCICFICVSQSYYTLFCNQSFPISFQIDKENMAKNLEEEARNCDTLICWLDCDREGENICFEVMSVCRRTNPNIKVQRAKFSSLEAGHIRHAVHNLTVPNENDNDAVDARQEIDLRIGAAFTRFQTRRLQRKFPQVLADTVCSYGPCQFPTLGFVVAQWRRRKAFIPEKFWSIDVTVSVKPQPSFASDEKQQIEGVEKIKKLRSFTKSTKGESQNTKETALFKWSRGKVFDQTIVTILAGIVVENSTAVVTAVENKFREKLRPKPLETVELQKRASRFLKLSSKDTMTLAEHLYQRGFISYPRTETDQFPEGADLKALIRGQQQSSAWGAYAKSLLEDQGFRPPIKGTKNDQAHPPIHPIRFTDTDFEVYNLLSLSNTTNFSSKEKELYEFIVRHFLACCSENAKGSETKVTIDIAQEQFTTTGLVVLQRNYLDVYCYDRWTGKFIPEFLPNQTFVPDSILIADGITTAPELLNEAQLISLMDKHGIGTDATMAQHIATIQDRVLFVFYFIYNHQRVFTFESCVILT